jgi:hypothetical protein
LLALTCFHGTSLFHYSVYFGFSWWDYTALSDV